MSFESLQAELRRWPGDEGLTKQLLTVIRDTLQHNMAFPVVPECSPESDLFDWGVLCILFFSPSFVV